MPEFVFHWMVLGEVYDDLGLERPHRDGAQQQPFPDGEYGCLFHARSLERPFSDGVHEDVCRGMDEDTQAVGLEGVAGEAVAFHALLELAYEQLVAPASAVGLLVEVLLADAPDVGNDEPDVELAFLGVLRLDHDPLWQEPCAGLVAELPVSPHGMVEQLVVMPHPLYGGLRGLIALQHAVPRQACDEEHAAVVQAGPVHQLVGAEVAVAAHGDDGLRPCLAQAGDDPEDGVLETDGLVLAAGLEQRQDHLTRISFEDHERHVAVAVVVDVEETLLLAPVGVHVRVVAVKDDVSGSLAAVGQDEHRDEHLLHAEKVLVGDHVLESAHRGRGAQFLVQGAGVDGKLHHRVAAHAVAVVHVLVAQANLEDAGHENLRKTVTHQVGSTAVVYATGKLGSQSQVLLLLPEHQQTAMRGKAHGIGRSLNPEVFYGGVVKFL